VELITAVGALISWVKFGPGGPALVAFIFFSCLVCLSFIDLEHQILPHVITLPAIPLFFAAAVLVMGVKFTDAIIGLMGGIASLYLVAVYYEAITGKEGMGGGDVNLAGLLGSFFGWQGLPFILFLAAFMGALVGLSLILFKGHHLKHAIPFGPFLSLGALFYLFFRQEIWGFLLTI
jgi:leader peptidase (prepilin peptidase)/N-methyltransferase